MAANDTRGLTCTCGDRAQAGFTMPELMAAICVLALLATCFYVTLGAILRLQKNLESERNSVIVMGNVLERLEAGKNRTRADVETIFNDEFRKSTLSQDGRIAASCEARHGVLILGIAKRDGTALASMELAQ